MVEVPAPLNFKAIATKQNKDVHIKQVQLSGSVAMKILQHCQETDPTSSCGQLLGLDAGSVLEVTESFPFLVRSPALVRLLCRMGCPHMANPGPRSMESRPVRALSTYVYDKPSFLCFRMWVSSSHPMWLFSPASVCTGPVLPACCLSFCDSW